MVDVDDGAMEEGTNSRSIIEGEPSFEKRVGEVIS